MAANVITLRTSGDGDDASDLTRDPSKDVVHIDTADGGVIVNLGPAIRDHKDVKFHDNLAESLMDTEMSDIAEDLIQGIEDDDKSRTDWLNERAEGIKHLALKIEKPDDSADGGSQRSMSRDTLLLEATLRFQANAGGELLPADGPVKVRDDAQAGPTTARSQLADDLETDINHYLTTIATEYYPDTDRMLFQVGFGGTGFKKVYRCPIRRRPVSESVEAPDLIVSSQATDLNNAERITHVVRMSRATMKRMQILGAYRDCDLGEPAYGALDRNAVDEAKENSSGLKRGQRLKDEPYILYECYCLIDVPGFEHEEKGKLTGLPLPYKVVIEKTSRQILEIRRNWEQDDEMQMAKVRFVKFPFVPGPFGFYDVGLLNIVGNPTATNTALLRILVDAGIFGNFPGFLYAKGAGRQNRLQFNIEPGQGVEIDTAGLALSAAVMALPYKGPDPSVLSLMEQITESAQRVAGTAELQVAEGRADAPVGTTLAMIEQATKMLNAVHRRLHQSQAREFGLLVELFRENPQDFWRFNKSASRDWDEQSFIQALDDCDLVPAADPNTSSHLQRIARAQAVYQIAKDMPQKFDIDKVLDICGKALREPDFMDAVLKGSPPPPQPDPKALAAQKSADADMIEAQAKAKQVEQQGQDQGGQTALKQAELQSKEKIAGLGFAKEQVAVQGKLQNTHLQATADTLQDRDRQTADLHHQVNAQAADQLHEHLSRKADQVHDVRMAGLGALLQPKSESSGGDEK